MGKKLPLKWLYFPSFVLIIFLIIKLIEKSQIIFYFPFDRVNDLSSYMSNLFFLVKYGYHAIIPNWYNGLYMLFEFYPPAWYFFAYPLYMILGKVETTVIVSMIITYALAFFIINLLGKKLNFSKIERLAIFAFIFANPLAIGNFVRLGRPHELLAWVFFTGLFLLVMIYRKKEIDMKFILLSIFFYSMTLLSHEGVFIVASFLFLPLLIIKSNKERIKIMLIYLISAILTSFWWIPFLKGLATKSSILGAQSYLFAMRLVPPLMFKKLYLIENITSFAAAAFFLIIFYFYIRNSKNRKKELVFFSIPLALGILYFFRIFAYIPFLNKVYPDIYNMFFIIFGIFLLLKTDFRKYSKTIKRLLGYSLHLIPLIAIISFMLFLPGFVYHTQEDKETMSLFSEVNGSLLISESASLSQAYYSYGAIYYNISTPSGWSNPSVPSSHVEKVNNVLKLIKEKNCSFIESAKEIKTEEIITYNEYCDFIDKCGLDKIDKKEQACLYRIK